MSRRRLPATILGGRMRTSTVIFPSPSLSAWPFYIVVCPPPETGPSSRAAQQERARDRELECTPTRAPTPEHSASPTPTATPTDESPQPTPTGTPQASPSPPDVVIPRRRRDAHSARRDAASMYPSIPSLDELARRPRHRLRRARPVAPRRPHPREAWPPSTSDGERSVRSRSTSAARSRMHAAMVVRTRAWYCASVCASAGSNTRGFAFSRHGVPRADSSAATTSAWTLSRDAGLVMPLQALQRRG